VILQPNASGCCRLLANGSLFFDQIRQNSGGVYECYVPGEDSSRCRGSITIAGEDVIVL